MKKSNISYLFALAAICISVVFAGESSAKDQKDASFPDWYCSLDSDQELQKAIKMNNSGDPTGAFKVLSSCAEKGSAGAMLLLALQYDKGQGTPKDLGKALLWLRKGYDSLRKRAKLTSDQDYLQGMEAGKQKNYVLAKQKFDASASKGFPDAMFQLAKMSALGMGVPKDGEKAFETLRGAVLELGKHFESLKDDAQQKACNCTLRVLYGALEMYSLDGHEPIREFSEDMLKPDGILVKGQYLKSFKRPTPQCVYISEGDISSDTGVLKCVIHGALPK
ncbi:MAG: sel1 repeat family protein [Candidatus Riflebacteria bacterium]|nr:sel1 repeat family protein [Candidatus Riflebacteria bacterium]